MQQMDTKQQIQNQSTLLQSLPNELFAEIFSYLNGIDAVFAFSQLNNRFQSLLSDFCQFFNFKSVSKAKFDFVVQRHNLQRMKSLHLSNDDHTPGQIQYFCQSCYLANHYSQLQSLLILNMTPSIGYMILSKVHLLQNLHSLSLESICGETVAKINLSKLKRLVLSSCRNIRWSKNFPQLENVEYTIIDGCSCQPTFTWPLTLKRLKISFINNIDLVLVQHSLTHLSQLITLEIYQKLRGRLHTNGQIWEELIRSSLPLLKHFKFCFPFIYDRSSFNPQDQIVASFSTPFYVHEKNWSVRCDVCQSPKAWAVIYTIPFAFDSFVLLPKSSKKSISTYFNDNNSTSHNNIYENVKTLVFVEKHTVIDPDLNTTQVNNLVIRSYFDSNSWLHLLTKLRHLEITSDARIELESFRLLLDNAPDLHSLSIEKDRLQTLTQYWSDVFICNLLSEKIQSLKLYSTMKKSRFFSKNELEEIIRIFASKCQHLSLSVQSPNNLIVLILQNMLELQSLHVNINESPYTPVDMIWLEKQQTKYNRSNCIIVNDGNNHYLWLG